MAQLQKEVWINQIKEKFYPDSSFLKFVKDFSSLVENHAINLAEAGVDPEVYINNTTYPLEVKKREDTPLKITLDLFHTENTLVRRPEVVEYSYDVLESVIYGHREALRAKTAMKAAHAYAPQSNGQFTPVISTTGETVAGRKRITIEDILNLKEQWDNMNIPLEGRFLVLNPRHVSDLILFDVKAFKDITDITDGQPRRFAGFNVLQTSVTPMFNKDTLEKKPFTETSKDTDTFCSFAFHQDEVMKADEEPEMYVTERDPKERATIIGFDKRFIAVPLRNKGIGAIVSTKL